MFPGYAMTCVQGRLTVTVMGQTSELMLTPEKEAPSRLLAGETVVLGAWQASAVFVKWLKVQQKAVEQDSVLV